MIKPEIRCIFTRAILYEDTLLLIIFDLDSDPYVSIETLAVLTEMALSNCSGHEAAGKMPRL